MADSSAGGGLGAKKPAVAAGTGRGGRSGGRGAGGGSATGGRGGGRGGAGGAGGPTGRINKRGLGLGRAMMSPEIRASLTRRGRGGRGVAAGGSTADAANPGALFANVTSGPKITNLMTTAPPGPSEDVDPNFRGLFERELRPMLYGFGDDEVPLNETVTLVEEILLQYLRDVILKASMAAADSLRTKPDERDILFVMRKDAPKFARIKELLTMQQMIKEARGMGKGDELVAATAYGGDEEGGGDQQQQQEQGQQEKGDKDKAGAAPASAD